MSKSLPDKKAIGVAKAIIDLLQSTKKEIKTITFDNGSEFSRFKEIEQALGCKTFFCHPHAPWEKGLIENTNGLLRQYFPKGTNFKLYSEKELETATAELNNRPRKTKGWKTPNELFLLNNELR